MKLKPAAVAVRNLLRQKGEEGATTGELLEVGGARYSSRLFELREDGSVVLCGPSVHTATCVVEAGLLP